MPGFQVLDSEVAMGQVADQNQANEAGALDAWRTVHDAAIVTVSGPATAFEECNLAGLQVPGTRHFIFVGMGERNTAECRGHPTGTRAAVGARCV